MEESRKQFESEWKKTMEHLAEQPEMQTWKNVCWHFWESSRTAIEIDLPPKMGEHQTMWDGTDWNQMHEHAVTAIRAAGLRVKEK